MYNLQNVVKYFLMDKENHNHGTYKINDSSITTNQHKHVGREGLNCKLHVKQSYRSLKCTVIGFGIFYQLPWEKL